MVTKLTKQSTEPEIRLYFEGVLKLSQSDEEFPVNLDDVWPLAYARKDVAVKKLKDSRLFIEGIDFQPLHQNMERSENGQFCGADKVTYMLSVPCLEFFIARKVRPVFEVYRKVFHKVAESAEVAAAEQQPDLTQPISLADTMQPLSDYMHRVDERWTRLLGDTASFADGHKKVLDHRQNWLVAYKNLFYFTSQLVYCESVNRIEGPQFV